MVAKQRSELIKIGKTDYQRILSPQHLEARRVQAGSIQSLEGLGDLPDAAMQRIASFFRVLKFVKGAVRWAPKPVVRFALIHVRTAARTACRAGGRPRVLYQSGPVRCHSGRCGQK